MLDDVLWLEVFLFLPILSIGDCLLVDKSWHRTARTNALWRSLFMRFLPSHFAAAEKKLDAAAHEAEEIASDYWMSEFGRSVGRSFDFVVEEQPDLDTLKKNFFRNKDPLHTRLSVCATTFTSHLKYLPVGWPIIPEIGRSPKCVIFELEVTSVPSAKELWQLGCAILGGDEFTDVLICVSGRYRQRPGNFIVPYWSVRDVGTDASGSKVMRLAFFVTNSNHTYAPITYMLGPVNTVRGCREAFMVGPIRRCLQDYPQDTATGSVVGGAPKMEVDVPWKPGSSAYEWCKRTRCDSGYSSILELLGLRSGAIDSAECNESTCGLLLLKSMTILHEHRLESVRVVFPGEPKPLLSYFFHKQESKKEANKGTTNT